MNRSLAPADRAGRGTRAGAICLAALLLPTAGCDRGAPTASEFGPSAPNSLPASNTPSVLARPRGTGTSPGPSSSHGPSASTYPASPKAPVTRGMDVATATAAPGPDLRGLRTIRVRGTDGTTTGPEQLLDDGGYVAVRSEPPGTRGDSSLALGTQELGIVRNGALKVLARNATETSGTLKGTRRQIIGTALTSKHLVWVETPSTDLNYCEWAVRVRDLATGTTRQIAHSPVLQEGRRILRVFGETRPFVLGDRVYWAANTPLTSRPDPGKDSDWRYDLLSARTDGRGGVTTIARAAALPAVDSGAVYYATTTNTPSRAFRIHRLSATGPTSATVVATGRLRGESALTNLAAGKGRLVWTVSSPDAGQEWEKGTDTPGHVFVMDTATRDVVDVTTADEVSGNYSIAFGPGRVLWGNGSGNGDAGQYLLDLHELRLHRLGRTQGFSTVLSAPGSSWIMWGSACSSPEDGGTCWMAARWTG